MFDIWDANARAQIAFALTLIAVGVVYIAFKLSERPSRSPETRQPTSNS